MINIKEYIDSGVLELYVFGDATVEEAAEVEKLAEIHPEIRKEIDEISKAMEIYAEANAIAPPALIKPFLLAQIDYSERLQNGEPITNPPLMNESSKIEDFATWLNRADMVLPANSEDIYAKIIGYTPEVISAIVWIKDMAENEVHDDEFEKFLIVEGTCNISVDDEIYSLVPGDYFAIPLYRLHNVKVTSDIPCKVILQRVAA